MATKKHLFRIWHSDSENRCEIGRMIASDIEKVEKYVRLSFINEDVPDADITLECYDEGASVFAISLCPQCDKQNSEECEFCENSFECIEIADAGENFSEEDARFDLITGETLTYREDKKGMIHKDKNHNQSLANLQCLSVMKRLGEL
jgi:hypothetical protein